MSANDNKIVPSDQSRSPASEDHDTRVATRAYAVRHGDTTLEHLSSERGLDYDEVLRLNPAVSARNGLLKAGDVLKLPKQGASGPKRADGVDGAAQSPGPSTAPSSADDANAPAVVDARIVGEADPAGDAPRGDSRDDGADDTGDPVPPGSRRTSREDDASSSASASEGTTETTAESSSPSSPPPPSSPTDDASSRPESLDDVREDMRVRGVSAVRGFGGVVGALVKTAGASVDGIREAAAASSAALRESSEDLQRTSAWVNAEVTGIATKAGEEIENLRRSRNAARKEGDDAAAEGGDPASESEESPGIAEAPAAGSTPPPPTPPGSPARLARATDEERAERRRKAEEDAAARREKSKSMAEAVRGKLKSAQDAAGSLVHKMRQDEGTARMGREDEKRKEDEGNRGLEEAAKARLAEAAAKRRAEAMARQAAREAERAARRKERDRLRDAQDKQRRAAAAAAKPAAAKPTAAKPAAAKPTAAKPTKQSEDKVQVDLKAKVEADRAKAEREREARRRDFEARRKAREERRKEKKGDASKVKPAESKPAFELPFQVKKSAAEPKPVQGEPAARIRALADRVRERPEETARVVASAAAGAAAGAIAGGLTRVGFVAAVAAMTRRAFENGLLATAGGIFWDGAGITAATRAKGELARVRAGGPDAMEPTFAESCRDARDARRLDLPARVGPALNFGRFLPGGGVVACLKLVLFGIAEERHAGDAGGASSADPAAPPGGADDDVAAIAALAAAEAAVAAAEAAAASTPETTPAKDSTHAVVPKLSPVPPGSPTTPATTPPRIANAAEPSSTPGTPPPRSAYPAKTPGKTRGGADDDDETDPLTPRTLGAVGMSGAASPPPASPAPAAPVLSPRRPPPGENATRDEYRVAELKLEGRRDALMQRYVAAEAAEGRTVDPTVIVPPSPAAPSRRWLTKTSPSASPSRGVPKLDLTRLNGNAEDESLTERRVGGDGDDKAASDKADPGVAKKFDDERAGDAELRWRVERLDRECAILEGRLAFREDEKTRELRAMREKETANAARRVKKSIWHFATSLKRRALLAWVLELDEATRRKRLLRKALARMRMRTLSDSFEGWLEFRRKAKEQRLERKVAELERRAAAAEAAEVAAQRDREAARREAEEKAASLAEAEAREAEARREVAAIRGEDAEPWSPASAATATPLGATTPASP